MKAKHIFKNILFAGSLYYTVITTLLIVINLLMRGDDTSQIVIDPAKFLLILLFSFIAVICSEIARIETLPRPIGVLISAVGHIGGFFFCLVLPSSMGFSGSVIITVLFAAVYSAAYLTAAAVKKKTAKPAYAKGSAQATASKTKSPAKKGKDTEYTSMFGGKDKR